MLYHFLKKNTPNVAEKQKMSYDTKTYSKKSFVSKKTWKEEEIGAVLKFSAPFIREKLYGKAKCNECMKKYPVFSTRKWTDVKFYVNNYISKIK